MNIAAGKDAVGERALSRLMLGTVQFGLPYGVANRTGQPAYETVREMLACALAGGVTCFDTAAAYGSSEAVLGRALHELGVADEVTVVTKIEPLTPGLSTGQARTAIAASVHRSLRRLQRETLSICLFHREENLPYWSELLRLRDAGLMRQAGCSVVSPTGARAALSLDALAAIQLPTNLLDRRFARVLDDAPSRGVALFARSVYLQGAILMSPENTPAHLHAINPVRRQLAQLARHAGLTLAELALRYTLSLPALQCVLVGVETLAQLRENLELFARGPLPADLLAAVQAAVPALPEAVLDPTRWPPAA